MHLGFHEATRSCSLILRKIFKMPASAGSMCNWRRQGNRLPVIVLTARDAWHERVDGFKAGADDYLGKPFHFEELLVRILALVRRSHHSPKSQTIRGTRDCRD